MIFKIFGRIFYFFGEERQWTKFYYYLNKYFFHNMPMILAAFIIIIIFLTIFLTKKTDRTKKHRWSIAHFCLYIVALFLILVLSKDSGNRGFQSFDIFSYIKGEQYYHETKILITLSNMIAFIPLGVLLKKACLFKSILLNCLCIFLVIIIIEAGQFFLYRGYLEIMDIVSYTVGAFTGFFLTAILCHLSKC